MQYILHDLSVFLWGVRSHHPNWKETRPAIVWPVHICSVAPGVSLAWTVRLQRPKLCILNAYELEQDYNQLVTKAIDAP